MIGARHESWRIAAAAKPAVFTIPAHLAFVDVLARGIRADAGDNPLALPAVTVLLPTRRACRSLREAFLRLSGGAPILLPRLMPLDDLNEEDALFSGFASAATLENIPPAIAPLKRRLFLARLILSRPVAGRKPTLEEALNLAAELTAFIDQVQTERLSFERLKDLAPEAYAEHWRETLQFLEIITKHWPEILREEGSIDPVDHRNRVFAAQAAAWAARAPGPVIAAGSTGSVPATADLLKVVASLPEGCVVLPALDQELDEAGWDSIDETHPQFGMKALLAGLGIARCAVRRWPGAEGIATARERLVSEVMRPAATTETWRALSGFGEDAVAGLARVDCPGPREEAEAVALVMRKTLETPEKTCALVTPDRRLAERVGAELKRWNIDVDDSAGRSLDRTPVGVFLRLTATMVAEDFTPIATLAASKHPLASAGLDGIAFRLLTRTAERIMLRGQRPAAGLMELKALAAGQPAFPEIAQWVGKLESSFGAFAALMSENTVSLDRVLSAHLDAAEAFAETAESPGSLRLWAGDAGEAMASVVRELAQYGAHLPPFAPRGYPAVLEALLAGHVVRPKFGRHPRLAILGPLEARLQRFDTLILSSLNEGTWPGATPPDPWMSRPMREAFGLPPAERRIGLGAHDVAQAMCAPGVVLTRAVKSEGTPTVPSRWLMRLEEVVTAAGLDEVWLATDAPWLSWAAELTHPTQFNAAKPPAPRPPLAARPRKLSVTQVETWMRDPYSIYARYVLNLRALPDLEQDASAADYGSLTHAALQEFVTRHPAGALPPTAYETLRAIGQRLFSAGAIRPSVMAFWWPRFERIAAWFVIHEQSRRDTLKRAHVEVSGTVVLKSLAGPFTLTAKADRIDETAQGLVVIDYKTGIPPTAKEVQAGFAPQLPLEAAMVLSGAFKDVPPLPVGELAYWHLHGRADGGDASAISGDAAALAEDARKRLQELIAAFDDPDTAYEARPNPKFPLAYSDYLHLARVKEWASSGDNEP